jgi:hypothetical protein
MDIACITNGVVVKVAAFDCRYQLCMKPIILMAKSFYNFNRVSERVKKLAATGAGESGSGGGGARGSGLCCCSTLPLPHSPAPPLSRSPTLPLPRSPMPGGGQFFSRQYEVVCGRSLVL